MRPLALRSTISSPRKLPPWSHVRIIDLKPKVTKVEYKPTEVIKPKTVVLPDPIPPNVYRKPSLFDDDHDDHHIHHEDEGYVLPPSPNYAGKVIKKYQDNSEQVIPIGRIDPEAFEVIDRFGPHDNHVRYDR